MTSRRIAIVGARGFIATNLMFRLREIGSDRLIEITRDTPPDAMRRLINDADLIFHLAGANRPKDRSAFMADNRDLTQRVCQAIEQTGRAIPTAFISSARSGEASPYGESKKAAEDVLLASAARTNSPLAIYRLPNVFGKWSRPNYNSVVATFCHNIARDLPITIHDPATILHFVYIDDVVDALLRFAAGPPNGVNFPVVSPIHETSVGALADGIQAFHRGRTENRIGHVGTGFLRALYATYVSFLPPEDFAYPIESHADSRGRFSEVVKTPDSGQFSYFTAGPGVTRGGHYHHTKTEKFLIVRGTARFRFRHIVTQETRELSADAATPTIVETIPGWAHDVTNIGDGELVALLWANEVFDPARPDTITAPL